MKNFESRVLINLTPNFIIIIIIIIINMNDDVFSSQL